MARKFFCVFFLFCSFFYSSVGFTRSYTVDPSKEENSQSSASKYQVAFGLGQLSFSDLVGFSELYHKPLMPYIEGSRVFKLTDFLSLGLGLKLSYTSTTGKQAESIPTAEKTESEVKPNDDTSSLTMVPFGFMSTLNISVLSFVTLYGNLGYEELYFQEMRTSSTPSADGKYWINSGSAGYLSLGGGIKIRLNSLDPKSSASLKHSIGIQGIYLSPFFLLTNKLGNFSIAGKASEVSFSHSYYGVGFSFET